MKKTLLSGTLILLSFSMNGCLKREAPVHSQQQIHESIIIPNTPIETPIHQNTIITTPSVNEPIYQSAITPIPSIDVPPPVEEAIPMEETAPMEEVAPIREIETPPPSAAGESHQLRTVQGKMLSVQERSNGLFFPQYPNKIILLQVFGQHCPYCLEEMPTLQRLQQQYAGNLQIIALQAEEPMGQSRASMFIQQNQMYYPVIDKEEATALLFFLQQTFEWTGILPYTLIIKDGVTEYPFSGPASYQELNEAIQSLL